MIPTYLFTLGAKLSRANLLDESLKVEVNNHVKMFIEGLDLLPPHFMIHKATKTDPGR